MHTTLLAKIFKDSKGNVVIWQAPNVPLIGWAVCLLLTRLLPAGSWHTLAEYTGFGFLFTWAWLEITQGENYFRKTLGIVVLAVSLYSKIS